MFKSPFAWHVGQPPPHAQDAFLKMVGANGDSGNCENAIGSCAVRDDPALNVVSNKLLIRQSTDTTARQCRQEACGTRSHRPAYFPPVRARTRHGPVALRRRAPERRGARRLVER